MANGQILVVEDDEEIQELIAVRSGEKGLVLEVQVLYGSVGAVAEQD